MAPIKLLALLLALGLWTQSSAASCIQSLPLTVAADSNAQTINIPLTAPSDCSWTATGRPAWITSSSSGSGTGTLALTLSANTTGADQSDVLNVDGLALTVTQRFTVQLFDDVPPATYYFDAVNLLKAKGITSGCSSTGYCPTQNITRAQMAIFIIRSIFGTGSFTYSQTPHFNDVQPTDFGFAWIQKMYELGITDGCATSLYCPDASVTRAEAAVFIIRARYGATTVVDIPATPYFTDVPPPAFAYAQIQRLREDNITSGCTPTTFCPSNPVLRADMAIFIMVGEFNQLVPSTEPIILSVTPTTVSDGSTHSLTIVGQNTNFVTGATVLNAVPGLVVNSVSVTDPQTLVASVTVNTLNPVQPLSIWVTDPTEEAVLPNGLFVQPPVIISFTTSNIGGLPSNYTPNYPFELGLLPQVYSLNDGTTWPTGAGSFSDGVASVTSSSIVGSTVQFALTPTQDPLMEFTEYDSGVHSAQGSFGAPGLLTLTATIGSADAVLSGNLLLESNTVTYYPAFDLFAAPVGALVPFTVTYHLMSGVWNSDTFNGPFSYTSSGQISFTQAPNIKVETTPGKRR